MRKHLADGKRLMMYVPLVRWDAVAVLLCLSLRSASVSMTSICQLLDRKCMADRCSL